MNCCQYETYHRFFSNLANKLRINIIIELRKTDLNVGELCDKLNIEQSKVSHALGVLKKCNIVHVEQKGKHRVYSLNKKTIVPMLKLIDKHSKTQCGECPYK